MLGLYQSPEVIIQNFQYFYTFCPGNGESELTDVVPSYSKGINPLLPEFFS